MIGRVVQKNILTAAYRRIFMEIMNDSSHAPWTGAVAGVKAQLSLNGGAEVASTADIVRVGAGLHYVELTQAEANVGNGIITARVAADGGTNRREAIGYAEVGDYDPFQSGATVAEVADGVWDEARAGHVAAGSFGEGVNVVALLDGIITAAKVAAGAIDADAVAADAGTEIATAILNTSLGVNYSNHTVADVFKIVLSVLASKASGLDTTTATFRNPADNANVVVATVDANGNRTVVTRTP